MQTVPSRIVSDESLRGYGYQVIDWIADYLTNVSDYPVLSRSTPGAIRRALPAHPPQEPEAMSAILADFEQILLPGISHWNSPHFMGYFAPTASPPGILGELLSAVLNVNGMLWRTSPVATELEQVTLDWLRQLLGLPQPLFGVINSTATEGAILALATARETFPSFHIRERGMAARPELPRLCCYLSQEAHVSLERAANILGIGEDNVRRIAVNAAFQMDVNALERAIEADRRRGSLPFAVIATVGTTSSSSIDPVAQIATICKKYGLWLHVDAAYGGSAAVMPEMRWVLEGCEHADSLVVSPHKWLFTPLDCSVLYTSHPGLLKRVISHDPEYLRTHELHQEPVVNFDDYTLGFGRRFRALKLWMVLRSYGQEGLAAHLREHCRLAQLLATWIDESPNFERLAPTPLNLVCFRAHPQGLDDETELENLNECLLRRINADGHFFLSHTRLHGTFTIRVAIGHLRTTEQVIGALWAEVQRITAVILAERAVAEEE